MKLCNLSSGSSGNATYIFSQNHSILLDCGVSTKYIEETFREIDVKLPEAIIISHEHIDHVSGLGVILRKYEIPVYTTEKTFFEIKKMQKLGKINYNLFNIIKTDKPFSVGDLEILPFSIFHDAVEPLGFRISDKKEVAVIATDLGSFDDYTIANIKGANYLLIEANHDIAMLEHGSYPWAIKRRIIGDRGHLSNDDSAKLLSKVITQKTKNIILGHLSSEHNFSDLARVTVIRELQKSRKDLDLSEIVIDVASKKSRSKVYGEININSSR